jgi:hypothetical protein
LRLYSNGSGLFASIAHLLRALNFNNSFKQQTFFYPSNQHYILTGMKKNFWVENQTQLAVKNQSFNICDDFDYQNFEQKQNNLLINFKRSTGDWIDEGLPVNIKLLFTNVSYFEVSGQLKTKKVFDLEELGYVQQSVEDIEVLLSEEDAEEQDHLLFWFEEDEFIRVCAEEANLISIAE